MQTQQNQKYKPNGNNLTSNKQHENIADRSIQLHSHYNGQLVTNPSDGRWRAPRLVTGLAIL